MCENKTLNTLSCPIIFNSYTIELIVHTSCYCLEFTLCYYLNSSEIIFIISSNQYCSPERYSNLGLSRIAVFIDCKTTALTTQPPRLVEQPLIRLTCFKGGNKCEVKFDFNMIFFRYVFKRLAGFLHLMTTVLVWIVIEVYFKTFQVLGAGV